MQVYRLFRVEDHLLLRVYAQQVEFQRAQPYGLI